MGLQLWIGLVFLFVLFSALLVMAWHIHRVYGQANAAENKEQSRATRALNETSAEMTSATTAFYEELEELRRGQAERWDGRT